MSAADTLVVRAPAKVNLYLAVGPVGADGYHPVRTILHTLELHDTLTIAAAAGFSFTFVPDMAIPTEQNLCVRAARAMAEEFARPLDVAIRLEKRIPIGAGLGGGSSDAAAVICGLAELWDIPRDEPRLSAVARSLGADVPFFLVGGAALFGGRGDVFERSLTPLDSPVTLAKPLKSVPTAEAYATFDRLPAEPAPPVEPLVTALEGGYERVVGALLYNAMAPAAESLVPAITDALELLGDAEGSRGVAVAGSGSAVFGIFKDAGSAGGATFSASIAGFWAETTRFSSRGCTVERT